MHRLIAAFRVSLFSLGVLLVIPSVTTGQVIRYVDGSATSSTHDGTSWCTAFLDLQEALAVASPGDDIHVADGTYKPDGSTGDRTASFVLPSQVQLFGGYAGCGAATPDARNFTLNETILSGDLAGNDGANFLDNEENSFHVVHYSDPDATGVVFDGFTVTAGNANGTFEARTNQGAGIHIRNNSRNCIPNGPTISNCIIRNNWSANHGAVNDHSLNTVIDQCVFQDNFAGDRGAGLFVQSGSPTVTNSQFLRNRVTAVSSVGGGMWMGSNSDPTCIRENHPIITQCTFIENESFVGGGVGVQNGSSPLLTDVDFNNNYALAGGGGAYIDAGNYLPNLTQLRRCTFTSNSTNSSGGGLQIYRNTQALIINTDFIANRAGRGGAGLRALSDSVVTIVNSRFIGNGIISDTELGTLWGGGVSCADGASVSATNTLFAGNRANYGGAVYLNGANNNLFTNCTMVNNSVMFSGGAFVVFPGATFDMVNTIVWGNTAERDPASSQISLLDDALAPCIRDSSIQNGWSGACVERIYVDDPLFVNQAGVDGVIGTIDDNYLLQSISPYIDMGNTAVLPTDIGDVDEDSNLTEQVPLDVVGDDRLFGAAVDLGAFETNVAACQPGSFSATGEEPCTLCDPGTFQPNVGGTACSPCPAGTFQPDPGAAICTTCAPGTFQTLIGQTTCDACTCPEPDACTVYSCVPETGDCEFTFHCPIPATSQWGLLIFTLLICAAGTVLLRQRAYSMAK